MSSRGRRTRRAVIASLALSSAVALAACGSSTAGPPPKRSPTTTTTAAPTRGAASTTSSTAAATTAPTAAPSTTAASSVPTATFGSWTGTEPTIVYFSGDSGNIVSGLTWTSWTSQSAVGHGSWGYESCDPNCAQGTVTPYPTTISLSDPVSGRFTQVTETQSGPHGDTLDFTLPDPGLSAS